MRFYEFRFLQVDGEKVKEALMGELLEMGFDSFLEEEGTLAGYLPEPLFRQDILSAIDHLTKALDISAEHALLEDKNWNEEWEKNYQPVIIAGRCRIRAPFHPPGPDFDLEITIEPGMAFGTAHHETTRLMAEWLLGMDVCGKTVLDIGCGTGVLAIMANKLGAEYVKGIDNDEWAWRNAMLNFRLNGLDERDVILGDARDIAAQRYHMILANINRNTLILDMNAYAGGLVGGGLLLSSGFYKSDRDAISGAARISGLECLEVREKNLWAAMLFRKNIE